MLKNAKFAYYDVIIGVNDMLKIITKGLFLYKHDWPYALSKFVTKYDSFKKYMFEHDVTKTP